MRSRNATSELDHVFYALSDPTRRQILSALSRGEANLTRLAARSRLSFAAVAKHVRVLERGKLADRSDGRAVVLELRPRPMKAGADWLDRHRCFWQERLAGLEEFVRDNYVPNGGADRG
jgi:DNA-binding transcriptional ArsR family regulator